MCVSLNFKLTGIDRGASGRTRNHGKTAAFCAGPGLGLLLEQAVAMPIYWPAWKPGWRWSASGAAIDADEFPAETIGDWHYWGESRLLSSESGGPLQVTHACRKLTRR